MITSQHYDDALLWSLVKKFTKTGLNSADDLMSEARATAAFAVKKYNANKKMALSTFILECVKNRMIEINRREKHRPELEFFGDMPEGSPYSESDLHFKITMQQLLDEQEYEIFHLHFVEDQSEREIAVKMNWTRWEVMKCLARIMHKYKLIEENHHKISTQRRLTNRWLEDSQL